VVYDIICVIRSVTDRGLGGSEMELLVFLKFRKETVIVIKWTAFHEYCNVDLYLYNLIFVLVAYEAD
jgi:hypothetical protein